MTQRGFLSFLPISLIFVLLISVQSSLAFQMGHGSGSVHVRVTDLNDRPIGVPALVQLVATGSASVINEAYCNDQGLIMFSSVAGGTYHLIVSGDGVERTDSGSFEVDERKSSQSIFVRVKKLEDTKSSGRRWAGGQFKGYQRTGGGKQRVRSGF